ncbi:MAG: hypothetical protein II267_04580 [Paludibacteraceae bacterium]|nr:hypothetical protein [Paludibacteraceae bacterium]MBQ2439148.1 hypothetical protein [Paludibacteraceae bacterium]
MENKYRIEIDDELGHVSINGKRFSITDAPDIFKIRMFNTMCAMKDGIVSRAIEVIVKEVEP